MCTSASKTRQLITACGGENAGARVVGGDLGGIGVDPVFLPRSPLFRAGINPDDYYNTSAGSSDINPNGVPFGFFHEEIAGRPDGYPLLLDIGMSEQRAREAFIFLRDGSYLSAQLTQ
eukprot:XP_001702990.1 predicted protein [Chlamydomonas reinhardtii]